MSIRFEAVQKSFGPKHILDGISFEAAPGEILFILGKSGMGKSVTLKHIVGMLKPDSGRVWVEDLSVGDQDAQGLVQVRTLCGMVFQHPALLDSLTIFENIAFGLRRLARLNEAEIDDRVRETLALVHLPESVLQQYPIELSYGMQKRASLARTLAPKPKYLLFDEPTTGLDPVSTQTINQLIFELSRKLKVTSLVVSHDMQCALKIADRILVLDSGKILSLADVKTTVKSKEPLIRSFIEETLNLLAPEERKKLEL